MLLDICVRRTKALLLGIYRKALSAAEVQALAKDGGVKFGHTNETQQ